MSGIHATATIDPKAELAGDVSVGANAVIHDGVILGRGCQVGPHVTIYPGTTIGEGTKIHAGAVIGDVPQDFGFNPANPSTVRIGAGCTLREGVTVHRGTKPETETVMGDGCFLMAFSHVAHNVTMGSKVILANGVLLAGYVEIGNNAFLSGNVVVHQFCRIGRLAMLGGNCGVSKDVPPFCTVRPVSLNRVAGLNVIGMRRAGIDGSQRQAVKAAFNTIYRGNRPFREAADEVLRQHADGPVAEFANFVKTARRGIVALRDDSDEEDTPE